MRTSGIVSSAPAIKEEIASPPDYVVYHPADLGKLGSTKLGLCLSGNGGCSNDGASSRIHLLEIASHGYLAIAPGRIRSGPGATVRSTTTTDAKGLMTALDWALTTRRVRTTATATRRPSRCPVTAAVACRPCK